MASYNTSYSDLVFMH